jgi:protein phosphatase
MNYEFCTRTDPGLARENNEDSVTVDEPTRLGILADGMGGYNAGEVASGMATTFIKSELGRWLAQAGRHANAREVRRAMEICVDNANRAIFNAANSNPQYAGMGTTLVVAVFRDDRVLLGHVGDSRCYRLRRGELELLTRDHSLLQEQLDAGFIQEALREIRDVLGPLAQRWQHDRELRQSKIQVGTKLLGDDARLQVVVGGRQKAHVE